MITITYLFSVYFVMVVCHVCCVLIVLFFIMELFCKFSQRYSGDNSENGERVLDSRMQMKFNANSYDEQEWPCAGNVLSGRSM